MKTFDPSAFYQVARRAMLGLTIAALLAGCAADRAFRSGLQGLEEGRYEEAIESLEEAVRRDPDNVEFRSAARTGKEQALRALLLEGEREAAAGDFDAANTTYLRMLALEPGNRRAAAGVEAVTRARQHGPLLAQAQKLFDEKDYHGALAKARQILAENPRHAAAAALQARIDDVQMQAAHGPIRLKSRYVKPVTLQFRDGDIRMVFEALSKATGINFIFDNDVRGGTRVTIFVNQVSVEDAIDLILAQSQLAQKVLNDNTILVYPATAAKHKDYREQIIKSFYLTNIDPKKAQNLLKVMLDAGNVFVDEKSSLLILRDTPEIVRMAEKLFAAADLPDPEVMLEVEVLEITRSTLQKLGIAYPGSLTLSAANAAGATTGLTVTDLRNLNESRVLVSPLSAGIDFSKQDGTTNVLASPRIRARNKEKAKVHIGDRVPVITNSVTPTTSQPVVTGSVQYMDVGLKLEIEPTVHLDNDVAIKVSLEVSSIVKEVSNAVSGTVAYQIGTRNASTLLRLKDGETQVLAGLINDEERNTSTKIPGLGDLPVAGRLFSHEKDDNTRTEIVLSITPRLVRNIVRPEAGITEFWFGSENQKSGKPLTIRPVRVEGAATRPAAPVAAATPPAAPKPPAPPAPAEVNGVPLTLNGPERVNVGEEFEVRVQMNADEAVSGMDLQLSYEPAVFEVVSVGRGAFENQAGAAERYKQNVDSAQGRIHVSVAPVENAGVTGEEDLVVVRFKAVAASPKSVVAISNAALATPAGRTLAAKTPAPIAVAANQG